MPRMIFVNLPVKDVAAAKAFYTAVGFKVNPIFTTEDCASIVVEDNIVLMLLTDERFRDFIVGDIADRDATEALVCLSADSRDAVDELCEKAPAAGASAWRDAQDYGHMYGRSFRDLDGHVIEVMWMHVKAATGLAGGGDRRGVVAGAARSAGAAQPSRSVSVRPLTTDSGRSATTSEPARASSSRRLISSHCGFAPGPVRWSAKPPRSFSPWRTKTACPRSSASGQATRPPCS